jgi:hypothetical protein
VINLHYDLPETLIPLTKGELKGVDPYPKIHLHYYRGLRVEDIFVFVKQLHSELPVTLIPLTKGEPKGVDSYHVEIKGVAILKLDFFSAK